MSYHFSNRYAFSINSVFVRISQSFFILLLAGSLTFAQHHPGNNCLSCHPDFKIGGTIFSDSTAIFVQPDVPVSLMDSAGNQIMLEHSNRYGNFASPILADGSYLIEVGAISSRTWHQIPGQGSCNTCHIIGGNDSEVRTKKFHKYHTTVPPDNNCKHCHHFPATQSLDQLMTPGVLNAATLPPPLPGSQVEIAGRIYPFDHTKYHILSLRPDIFATGFFSMFDVIVAVANINGISLEYYYDDSRKTHFLTKINGLSGSYWYHFSYDAGSGNNQEIRYQRANRWDETLWRPGVWIQVVRGENLDEIKKEYLEEISREKTRGHIIPSVRLSINPSSYQGNPPELGRITVNREFQDVPVTAHNFRSTGFPSPYSKPFQPGVVTSLDILLSLMDQGKLNVVTGVFYNHFAQNYIDSYYIVELGFPDVGVAHASGRQGFVYITENGAYNNLPNNADNKFHITSDISVIHAPDFSYWRWIELGNPYYEAELPTKIAASLLEDYAAISQGFNLHRPVPNPFNSEVNISFNLFESGGVNVSVYNIRGQKIATLLDEEIDNIGIHRLKWQPNQISSGIYYLVMKFERQIQMREILFLK